MDRTLHDHLNEALLLWTKITDVDPHSRKWSLGEYEIHKTYEELNEAQKLDPTGLTTTMLLRSFIEWWTLSTTYSANDLLNRSDDVNNDIARMHQIIGILNRPEVREPTDKFLDSLRKAVKHYEIIDTDVDKLLDEQFEIAYLRRDALLAINKLTSHQFSKGNFSKEKIKYSKNIYQFWNVNSLLKEIAALPFSGVVLCLIRDPEACHSYFVFAIRNGGNITLLTDKTDWAHPLQKHMRRRPDRDFEDRAFRYHFPYNLLECFIGEDDKIKIPEQEGLVRYNVEAIVLGKINKVYAESMIWLTMMLKLIEDKYWYEKSTARRLSYTGEMVAFPRALKDVTRHLPIKSTGTLELPRLTTKDITTDKLVKTKQWDGKPTGHNEWMIKRYGSKISADYLNLVGNKNLPLLPGQEQDEDTFFKDRLVRFEGLDPTEFGTRKKLIQDAQFIARHNQALMINHLAEKEYEEKEKEIMAWYTRKIQENKQALIEATARGEFIAIAQTRHPKESFDWSYEQEENILTVRWQPDGCSEYYVTWIGERTHRQTRKCCIRGVKASVFGVFRPMVPAAIATLCNCKVKKLPWPLQNYYKEGPYIGNSILDRIDPMEWAAENPWQQLRLQVVVCLSKTAFNETRKDLGLSWYVKEDWEKIRLD